MNTTLTRTATRAILAIGFWHDPRQLHRLAKHFCGDRNLDRRRTHAEALGMWEPDDCPKTFSIAEALIDGVLLPPMIGWQSSAENEVGVIRSVSGNHRCNAALLHGLRLVPMLICKSKEDAMELERLEHIATAAKLPSPFARIDWRYQGDFAGREYTFLVEEQDN